MFEKFLPKINSERIKKNIPKPIERPDSPREVFGAIFDVVQLSQTFKDSKTFVDAIPKKRPWRIARNYRKQYGTQLDIRRFVEDHFTMPPMYGSTESTQHETNSTIAVREHIGNMWDMLTREPDDKKKHSSLLPLPHSYIVPGGRFREIYYWDSYFTILGLREDCKNELIENIIKNGAHLIDTYGFIPNGNRTYYLTRSQPPVFAMMVELLAEINGEQALVEYLPTIEAEYRYWMSGAAASKFESGSKKANKHVVRMRDGEILNRYWDESISPREESFIEDLALGRTITKSASFYRNVRACAESGWDFSSRWLKDTEDRTSIRTIDIVPIDLNILMLRMEEILSRAYRIKGRPKTSQKYDALAQERRDAIQKYMWHEEEGWFFDYVHSEEQQSAKKTIAAAFALFAGVATAEQAGRIANSMREHFLRAGGIGTTLEHSGEQWDIPNGWAPMQYVAVIGLDRYGETELAEEIATRWCKLNISLYEKTGILFEKYDIENTDALAGGGEYQVQKGFGWTNGVLLALMNKYHMYK